MDKKIITMHIQDIWRVNTADIKAFMDEMHKAGKTLLNINVITPHPGHV